MIIRKKTKETDISIVYNEDTCEISIYGKGDFKHHLVEDILLLLAESLEMKDHLGLVWRNIKVKADA